MSFWSVGPEQLPVSNQTRAAHLKPRHLPATQVRLHSRSWRLLWFGEKSVLLFVRIAFRREPPLVPILILLLAWLFSFD